MPAYALQALQGDCNARRRVRFLVEPYEATLTTLQEQRDSAHDAAGAADRLARPARAPRGRRDLAPGCSEHRPIPGGQRPYSRAVSVRAAIGLGAVLGLALGIVRSAASAALTDAFPPRAGGCIWTSWSAATMFSAVAVSGRRTGPRNKPGQVSSVLLARSSEAAVASLSSTSTCAPPESTNG